jgi:hypothetical protein
VAVLTTAPNAARSELHLFEPGEASGGAAVAELRHAAGTLIKAAVVPGSDAVAVSAVPTRGRDLSFAAALFLLRPGQPAERIAGSLQHGVRPVTTSSQVFVVRGRAGGEPSDSAARRGALRQDALTLEAVDLKTKEARVLYRSAGQLLMPIGVIGGDLIIYMVRAKAGAPGDDEGALAAVPLAGGEARPLVAVSPLSRDFVMDDSARAVLFTGQDPHAAAGQGWMVQRYVVGGKLEVLARGGAPSLSPFAWLGDAVAYSRPGGGGLTLVGGTLPAAPLGPGIDVVRALICHRGVWWAVGLHRGSEPLPRLFSYDIAKKSQTTSDLRGSIEIAGVSLPR